MVKYCCLKDCNSGRLHADAPYHMFNVPKDANLFNKWKDALALHGTTLKKSHYVCEKHFNECDIRRNTVLKDKDGNILFQRSLQRVFLNKGAVPTLLGISTDHTMEVGDENINPTVLHSSESSEEISSTSKDIKFTTNTHVPHLNPSATLEPLPAPVETLLLSNKEDEFFSQLFDGKMKPDLPDKSWSICMQDFPNKVVVFQKVGMLLNSGSAPWYEKQMVLNENLNVQMYVMGKSHVEVKLGPTIQNLEHVIAHFNEMQVCAGGPPSCQYKNVHLTCGYKDSSGKWRHNLCTVEVSNSSSCKSCAILDHTLRQHLLRRKSVKTPQIV